MKTCSRCNVPKPLTDFPKNRSTADGRHPYCTPCKVAYNQQWRHAKPERMEHIQKRTRAKRAKQYAKRTCKACGKLIGKKLFRFCAGCRKARMNAATLANYYANKERYGQNLRKWKLQHPERWAVISARFKARFPRYTQEWVKQNRERSKEINKKSFNKNRAKYKPRINHQNRMRKARVRGASGHCAFQQWLWRLEFFGWRCIYCGAPLTTHTATRDHKIPVSKNGSNWPSNLVPACKSCNSRRHNKPFLRFLTSNSSPKVQLCPKDTLSCLVLT